MNSSIRIYDKKDQRRLYLNKFGIISIYKYFDNYIEGIIIDGTDSVVYLKKDRNTAEYVSEKALNKKYYYSTWEDGEYSNEYRVNLQKDTVWKKKFKKIGNKIFSYSEYFEKGDLIESNFMFAVDRELIKDWTNLLKNEQEKI